MWVMLSDCFLSIVYKDCGPDDLLVRARRPGDIEKVFGRRIKVVRVTNADYLYRAVVPRNEVRAAMIREIDSIDYDNFKDSVTDNELHDAYLQVWTNMLRVQNPRPYSNTFSEKKVNTTTVQFTPEWTAPELIPPPKAKGKKGKNGNGKRKQ